MSRDLSSKRDYYEILGVTRDAGDQDLKQAYRRLAIKFHPDKNPGDQEAEEKFKEIAEAYQILSSPDMRARYDRYGHAGIGAAAGGSPFGAGFGQGFPGFEDVIGDLFGDFFGQRSRRGAPRRGADLEYHLEMTLEEAASGLKTKIRVPRRERCDSCKGTGAAEGATPVRCATCGGNGQVRYQQGFFSVSRTCSTCRGTGRVIKDVCKECRGEGRIEKEKTHEIKIPAGVDSGSRLRLSGEGEAGEPGAPNGDLHVVLHVKEHEIFERRDSNLYCSVPISFTQAALGAEVPVPTLNGSERLRIPEGTQSASVFRMKGKGMPGLGGRGQGDMFVAVNLVTPTHLTREQRKLLDELSKLEASTDRGSKNKPKDNVN